MKLAKQLIVTLFLALGFSVPQLVSAVTCKVSDGTSHSGFPRNLTDYSRDFYFSGSQLPSHHAKVEGTRKVIRDTSPQSVGFVTFGPYFHALDAKDILITPIVEVSTLLRPKKKRECIKRSAAFGRRCVEWRHRDWSTSFSVDYSIITGSETHRKEIWKKKINFGARTKNLEGAALDLPTLYCNGPIKDFEVRISGVDADYIDYFSVNSLRLLVQKNRR